MNEDRLERLAALLDRIEEERRAFDIGSWAMALHRRPSTSETIRGGLDTRSEDEICGTTACAMGYAALDREFRAEGLELAVRCKAPDDGVRPSITFTPVSAEAMNAHLEKLYAQGCRFWDAEIAYEGESGIEAAAAFFDIRVTHAMWLFEGTGYRAHGIFKPTAADVAARIREFIAFGPASADA